MVSTLSHLSIVGAVAGATAPTSLRAFSLSLSFSSRRFLYLFHSLFVVSILSWANMERSYSNMHRAMSLRNIYKKKTSKALY